MEPTPNVRPSFWRAALRFQKERITPWIGARNAIGVALPLAVAAATGALPAGLAMATGALNVAFSDGHDPYFQRARRLLAACLAVGLGVFAGTAFGRDNLVIVPLTAVWAFASGMLVSFGQAPADLGAVSLVTLVVYSALPLEPAAAILTGALAIAGGLVQTVLAVALWPLQRYAPERRALGDLFLGLAASASGYIRATEPPPATAESTQAQASLATLHRDHSIDAERYLALLSQAERIRLVLMILARLRTRLARDHPGHRTLQEIDRFFELSAEILRLVGHALAANVTPAVPVKSLDEMRLRPERLRSDDSIPPAVADIRQRMDALAGQFRAVLDLASRAMPGPRLAAARADARTPWRLRLGGVLATLRANLSFESAAFRHAVRLAVCVAGGETVARGLSLHRAYWLPMTVAIVLKPDFTATFTRGVLRLGGTLVGLLASTALFHALPEGRGFEVLWIGIFTFIVRCWGPANYGVATAGITGLVVLLLALNGSAPAGVMLARAVNTLFGGTLALVAYRLWPTWERTQLSEAIARTLDAYRAYFQSLRQSYEKHDAPPPAALDARRLAGRRARSNLEASVDRVLAEPGNSEQRLRLMAALMANSHRLAHGLMALEAGLLGSAPVLPRPAFRAFANDVELTLYYLSAVLRGSPIDRGALPDLREDHHALVQSSPAPPVERYALVDIETDRITNSLNTLAEDVFRWIEAQ